MYHFFLKGYKRNGLRTNIPSLRPRINIPCPNKNQRYDPYRLADIVYHASYLLSMPVLLHFFVIHIVWLLQYNNGLSSRL